MKQINDIYFYSIDFKDDIPYDIRKSSQIHFYLRRIATNVPNGTCQSTMQENWLFCHLNQII